MIRITDKHKCCGCGACVQRCPKRCIALKEDDEGFLYPFIDTSECIDCGLCERVCPIIKPKDPRKPQIVIAALNNNEDVRLRSSSGGLFYLLASHTILQGGVVFGAGFDERWNVIHKAVETDEEIENLLGSKYVQSCMGDCYVKAENYLKGGRKVLFSGTGCQIAGLYSFLRREYENLVTIDVLCHGVPSPMIWRDYLDYECLKHKTDLSEITSVSFREKSHGWVKFSMQINTAEKNLVSESLYDNIFLKGFLRDLYLRPSCYECQFRQGKCHSDITIADYWGIWNHHPNWNDDKGTSLVLVNTVKGQNLLNIEGLRKTATTYEEALQGNSPLERSVAETSYRKLFWSRYPSEGFSVIDSICQKMRPSILKRIVNRIKSINDRR